MEDADIVERSELAGNGLRSALAGNGLRSALAGNGLRRGLARRSCRFLRQRRILPGPPFPFAGGGRVRARSLAGSAPETKGRDVKVGA